MLQNELFLVDLVGLERALGRVSHWLERKVLGDGVTGYSLPEHCSKPYETIATVLFLLTELIRFIVGPSPCLAKSGTVPRPMDIC